MNVTAVAVAKFATSCIVGAGTKKIIGAIVDNNVQPEKTLETIEVAAGSYVLAAIVANASKQYTDAKIDALAKWWNEHKDKTLKETIEEKKPQVTA